MEQALWRMLWLPGDSSDTSMSERTLVGTETFELMKKQLATRLLKATIASFGSSERMFYTILHDARMENSFSHRSGSTNPPKFGKNRCENCLLFLKMPVPIRKCIFSPNIAFSQIEKSTQFSIRYDGLLGPRNWVDNEQPVEKTVIPREPLMDTRRTSIFQADVVRCLRGMKLLISKF